MNRYGQYSPSAFGRCVVKCTSGDSLVEYIYLYKHFIIYINNSYSNLGNIKFENINSTLNLKDDYNR